MKLSKNWLIAAGSGFLGSLGLFLVYFLIVGLLSRNWRFPLNQFLLYKDWMSVLVSGFGVQFGLLRYLRLKHLENMGTKAAVGAGAGISTVGMIACCTHHLTELVPFLGLSALSFLVSQYQVQLFALGVLTNIFGIIIMVRKIKKNKC